MTQSSTSRIFCASKDDNGYPCPNKGVYRIGSGIYCGDHRDAAQSAVSEAERALAGEAGKRE